MGTVREDGSEMSSKTNKSHVAERTKELVQAAKLGRRGTIRIVFGQPSCWSRVARVATCVAADFFHICASDTPTACWRSHHSVRSFGKMLCTERMTELVSDYVLHHPGAGRVGSTSAVAIDEDVVSVILSGERIALIFGTSSFPQIPTLFGGVVLVDPVHTPDSAVLSATVETRLLAAVDEELVLVLVSGIEIEIVDSRLDLVDLRLKPAATGINRDGFLPGHLWKRGRSFAGRKHCEATQKNETLHVRLLSGFGLSIVIVPTVGTMI